MRKKEIMLLTQEPSTKWTPGKYEACSAQNHSLEKKWQGLPQKWTPWSGKPLFPHSCLPDTVADWRFPSQDPSKGRASTSELLGIDKRKVGGRLHFRQRKWFEIGPIGCRGSRDPSTFQTRRHCLSAKWESDGRNEKWRPFSLLILVWSMYLTQ
jgi:hypothetical protein